MKKLIVSLFVILFLFISFQIFAEDSYMNDFYEEVNERRKDKGVPELPVSKGLEQLAYFYSTVCADKEGIEHTYVDDRTVFAIAAKYKVGYLSQIGEILQYGDAAKIEDEEFLVQRFIDSPSHKDVLMHEDGDMIGGDYVVADNTFYLTVYIGRE